MINTDVVKSQISNSKSISSWIQALEFQLQGILGTLEVIQDHKQSKRPKKILNLFLRTAMVTYYSN